MYLILDIHNILLKMTGLILGERQDSFWVNGIRIGSVDGNIEEGHMVMFAYYTCSLRRQLFNCTFYLLCIYYSLLASFSYIEIPSLLLISLST